MPWWQVTLEVIQSGAGVAVPIVVAVLGYNFNQRVKLWEASQWRNQELIKMRVAYYQSLAPRLNDIMCYFTFIGAWKTFSPSEMVTTKRSLDRDFHSALPLFTSDCEIAYNEFMHTCFQMFGQWGEDARLRTGFVRRRNAYPEKWESTWEELFTHTEDQQVPENELAAIRSAYSAILGALARDIELLAPRDRYATERVTPLAY